MPTPGDTMNLGGHVIKFVEYVRDPAHEIRVRKTRRGMVHAVAEHINRNVSNVKATVIDGKRVGLELRRP